MGVAVFLGWGLGAYLDSELDTGPYLMVICLLFGVAAGFNGLIRVARQAKNISEESNE
jgi:F0F1-type ATP synthase assembly protein I